MAKIVEEIIVIKISQIVKDDATGAPAASDEFVAAIQAMAEELLADPKALVEVERT